MFCQHREQDGTSSWFCLICLITDKVGDVFVTSLMSHSWFLTLCISSSLSFWSVSFGNFPTGILVSCLLVSVISSCFLDATLCAFF